MANWVIEKFDGLSSEVVAELPGNYSEPEIENLLRHLVCTTLSPSAIVSSLKRQSKGARFCGLLERVGGTGKYPIHYGHGSPSFTARKSK